MTFGRRLGLFFCLIVLVPMLAAFLLLVFVSKDAHEGKADARLGASVETAVSLYSEQVADAARRGRALASDPQLAAALEGPDQAALRAFAATTVGKAGVEAIQVLDTAGRPLARAGSAAAVAFAALELRSSGEPAGTLRVSTTTGAEFAADVKRHTGREVVAVRDGAPLAGTVEFPAGDEASSDQLDQLEPGTTGDVDLGGDEFRARTQQLDSDANESVMVLGPREKGGLLAVPPVGAALLLVLLLLATGVAYSLARTLTQLHDRVASEAITDPLTGLYNRRRLQESLSREVDRATRFGHELALLIIDVDEFKSINDSRGHPAGDAVLQAVSEILRAMTRTIDLGIRYGGDELAVIVIETGMDGGERLAERLRAGVAGTAVEVRSGDPVRATVSIGVAAVPDSATDTDSLVDAADQALLEAKRAGKNQIRTR